MKLGEDIGAHVVMERGIGKALNMHEGVRQDGTHAISQLYIFLQYVLWLAPRTHMRLHWVPQGIHVGVCRGIHLHIHVYA